ncbi:hypothetical protein Bhyg_01181, partial [Pseudolycoriella hygida]
MENPDQFTESQRTSSSDDEIIDVENVPEERLWHLPQSRIKAIMKLDPDMNLVSTDSVGPKLIDVWRTCNKIRSAVFRSELNLWNFFKSCDPSKNTLISGL